MAYLTLNGWQIPVLRGSSDSSFVTGATVARRSFAGGVFRSERWRKRQVSVSTSPQSKRIAEDIANMVAGLGWSWSFNESSTEWQYSDGKGTELTEAGTTATWLSSGGKFGGYIVANSDVSLAWANGFDGRYTVAVWRNVSSTWTHYVVSYDGSTTRKWVDGTRNDAASTTWLTVDSTSVTLSGGGTDDEYDDLVILPYTISDARGDAWPQTYAYPAIPQVEAEGEFFDLQSGDRVTMQLAPGTEPAIRDTYMAGETKSIVSFALEIG